MGFLAAIAEYRASKTILGHPQDPVLARWFGADLSTSGVYVDENSALNYSACWAATRILSGTCGMLPLKMYRRTRGGGKEEARDRPEWKLVHDRPNPRTTSVMFRSSRVKFQVNSGNAYAEIERTGNGNVTAIWQIHSSRVEPFYDGASQLMYRIKNNDGSTVTMDANDVLHFPSVMSDDGIVGRGVVAHARESIGMGIATERHGAALFGNGARPGVVVEHPTRMSDQARTNFRKEWNEMYQGPENAHKMALLSEGAKLHEFGFSAEDSQFLETRQHNIEEVARWYGVPPHKIQHMLRSTFNNIEHQSIEFVQDCVMPWLVIWEQELNRKLLSERDQETYFFEHCVDGLLRGDAYTRAQALALQLQNGALNIDEWRAIENRNPLPDGSGQKHFIQLNMTTTDKAGEVEEPAALAVDDDETDQKLDAIAQEQYSHREKLEAVAAGLAEQSDMVTSGALVTQRLIEDSNANVSGAILALNKTVKNEASQTRGRVAEAEKETAEAVSTSITTASERHATEMDSIAARIASVERAEGERREQLFQACFADFQECLTNMMKNEQNDLRQHAKRKGSDLKSLEKFSSKFYRDQQHKLERALARTERWWGLCAAGPRWNANQVAKEFVEESQELLRRAVMAVDAQYLERAVTAQERNILVMETLSDCLMKWDARPQAFTNRFIRKGEDKCVA